MTPLVKPSVRLKNGAEIAATLRRASIVTGKIPADLANRFALSTAIRARKNLPAVDPGEIRSELGESKAMELHKLKSGKFSRAKKHLKSVFGAGDSGVPFLALLVQARANPNSRFNIATNQRFALSQSPFKGVSRAEGAARMLETMRRMFAGRVRSTGFLKLAAGTVIGIFRTAGRKTKSPPPASAASSKLAGRVGKIANGTPATGNGKATASFWVGDPLSASDEKYLNAIAKPVWDQAMQDELKSLKDYVAKKEYTEALKAAGLKVS